MALPMNQFELVDGHWRPRTVHVDTILRHHDEQDNRTPLVLQTAPTLGLLTQTVIQSPLAHWILPLKARDSTLEDVAFVGVRAFFYLISFLGRSLHADFTSLNLETFQPAINFLIIFLELSPSQNLHLC